MRTLVRHQYVELMCMKMYTLVAFGRIQGSCGSKIIYVISRSKSNVLSGHTEGHPRRMQEPQGIVLFCVT